MSLTLVQVPFNTQLLFEITDFGKCTVWERWLSQKVDSKSKMAKNIKKCAKMLKSFYFPHKSEAYDILSPSITHSLCSTENCLKMGKLINFSEKVNTIKVKIR